MHPRDEQGVQSEKQSAGGHQLHPQAWEGADLTVIDEDAVIQIVEPPFPPIGVATQRPWLSLPAHALGKGYLEPPRSSEHHKMFKI